MYEIGLLAAFCLWLFYAIQLIVAINSTFSKNLRRVGQRMSWLTLRPEPMDSSHLETSRLRKVVKYTFIQLFALPFILLSWIYVAVAAGIFIYARMKDSGKPRAYRELAWKMKNIDMPFDQIIREMAKAQELSEADTAQLREQVLDEMEMADLLPRRKKHSDWVDTE